MTDGNGQTEKGQDKPQTSFKVDDRRLFTAEGNLRRELPQDTEEPAAAATTGATRPSEARAGFARRPVEEPEGMDFTVLINAMMQPALIYLGEIPHPGTGKPVVDLEQARVQIDMLDLLRVKTRGNLSSQEESLLERVLYQLRMLYVSRTGAGAKT